VSRNAQSDDKEDILIHHTTTEFEGETHHWVSLDGEDWLPINRAPVEGDTEEEIQKLFDGDGNFMPMRAARGILIHWGAQL
jgi:hypothetical protein